MRDMPTHYILSDSALTHITPILKKVMGPHAHRVVTIGPTDVFHRKKEKAPDYECPLSEWVTYELAGFDLMDANIRRTRLTIVSWFEASLRYLTRHKPLPYWVFAGVNEQFRQHYLAQASDQLSLTFQTLSQTATYRTYHDTPSTDLNNDLKRCVAHAEEICERIRPLMTQLLTWVKRPMIADPIEDALAYFATTTPAWYNPLPTRLALTVKRGQVRDELDVLWFVYVSLERYVAEILPIDGIQIWCEAVESLTPFEASRLITNPELTEVGFFTHEPNVWVRVMQTMGQPFSWVGSKQTFSTTPHLKQAINQLASPSFKTDNLDAVWQITGQGTRLLTLKKCKT